jgi:hypothetical protein
VHGEGVIEPFGYSVFVAVCRLDEDDNAESQEVLEDQLTRQLTREYLDLISQYHSLVILQ